VNRLPAASTINDVTPTSPLTGLFTGLVAGLVVVLVVLAVLYLLNLRRAPVRVPARTELPARPERPVLRTDRGRTQFAPRRTVDRN
jgi:hypothetical protein